MGQIFLIESENTSSCIVSYINEQAQNVLVKKTSISHSNLILLLKFNFNNNDKDFIYKYKTNKIEESTCGIARNNCRYSDE